VGGRLGGIGAVGCNVASGPTLPSKGRGVAAKWPLVKLLCRFCGCLWRRRAACGAASPRSRAPSASLRDGARATLDLRVSTAPPGTPEDPLD
jgi:hypothetical protein